MGEDRNEGSAIVRLLADRLVVEDGATNARTEPGRGYKQPPIGGSVLLGLGNPQPGKSFVAGWSTFIYCQQGLVSGD
jgi:hypothetical protein